MADLLPKKFRKALRGELDVKSRNAPAPLTTIRNPDLPKWDYSSGGYTRSIKEQNTYMKEKAQKKSDKKFKEEAGFGDYALEVGGYAGAAYLYFKLPKIGGLAGKAIRGIGKQTRRFRNARTRFNAKWITDIHASTTTKTQRKWRVENIVSKGGDPSGLNRGIVGESHEGLLNLKTVKRSGLDQWRGYQLRSLLTGKEADKIEKDILKKIRMSPKEIEQSKAEGKLDRIRESKQKAQDKVYQKQLQREAWKYKSGPNKMTLTEKVEIREGRPVERVGYKGKPEIGLVTTKEQMKTELNKQSEKLQKKWINKKYAYVVDKVEGAKHKTDVMANLKKATATERIYLQAKQKRDLLHDVYDLQPKSWKKGDPLEKLQKKEGPMVTREQKRIALDKYHKGWISHLRKLEKKGQYVFQTADDYLKSVNKIKGQSKKKIAPEFKSKGKVKLLKKQNWGTGNISKGNVVDPSISNLNEKLRNVSMKKGILSEPTGGKLPQFQTKSKKQLLSNQPVKSKSYIQKTKTTSTTSKGGGKSGGGGGGKFGGNIYGRYSPWSLLRNNKNF